MLRQLKSNNFSLCYNPSFIAQGSIINNIINPDIILIGIDDDGNTNKNKTYCKYQQSYYYDNTNYNKIVDIYDKILINDNGNYKRMNLLESEITKLSLITFSSVIKLPLIFMLLIIVF